MLRTVSGAMPAGGTATVVYSREKNAGVLVMNNVPPPSSGTVYQMWLMGDNGAKLAGTMDAKAVAPSTTAVIREIGKSNALRVLGGAVTRLHAAELSGDRGLPLT